MWCHVSEGKSDNPFQPVEPGVNVSISKELVSSVSKEKKDPSPYGASGHAT